jgi:hypothetical protein
MRLTLKKYEQAKEAVEKARESMKTIKAWDDAMKTIGDTGNQTVVAITIKDGRISTECEFNETADKPIVKGEAK